MSEPELDPETETWRRDRPYVAGIATVAAYACAIVAAGHGIAPVGMVLALAFQRETYDYPRATLLFGAVLGLAGIALVVAHLVRRDRPVLKALIGLGALSLSLLVFSMVGDFPPATWVTAIPFGMAAAWLLRLTGRPAPQPPPAVS